jgi:hypothetical protein
MAEDDAACGALAAQPEVTAPPYPDWRFDVMTRGGEPGALGAHTGICAGAASNRRPYRNS